LKKLTGIVFTILNLIKRRISDFQSPLNAAPCPDESGQMTLRQNNSLCRIVLAQRHVTALPSRSGMSPAQKRKK
jgi:hypothetical protein